MGWTISEDGDKKLLNGPGLRDEGVELKSEEEAFTVAEFQSLPLQGFHSSVKITFDKRVKFERSQGEAAGITMTISAGTTLQISITPVIPLSISDKSGVKNNSVEWEFSGGPLSFSYKWNEDTADLLPDDKDFADILFDMLNHKWSAPEKLITDLFKRRVTTLDLDTPVDLGQLTLNLGKPVWKDKKLTFSEASAELRIGVQDINFKIKNLTLDPNNATLASQGQDITLKLENDHNIPGRLLNLKLHAGSVLTVIPSGIGSTIKLERSDGQPAVTASLSGSNSGNATHDKNPFVFETHSLTFGAGGLQGDLQCRPTSLVLGNENSQLQVQVNEGLLSFNGGHFTARVQASARLPFWQGAEGTLLVLASSGKSDSNFLATWAMQPVAVWRDPSGSIEVYKPRATVSIVSSDNNWQLDGSVGGELRLVNGSKLLGEAGDWLADFLKDFRLEFDELDLSELTALGKGALPRLSIKPVGQPSNLRLWKLFDFKLTSFDLYNDKSFGFGGILGFESGGVYFEGTLPRLRVKCSGGLSISRESEDALTISGRLRTQGGVEAQFFLVQVKDEQVSELQGAGSLMIPGFPTLGITCSLGRRNEDNAPLIMLFVQSDYPITLYPGVVMRQLGLGFGVNKVLKGVNGKTPEALVPSLISDPAGLPNPVLHSGWETPEYKKGMQTDVSFAAQSYLAPSPRGEGPFPYVGRVTLFVRPTNETLIMLATNLWVFTSLQDAATEEFQRAPALKGIAAIFPRHGYFEMMVRTERRPRMSQPLPLLQQAFEIGSGEFYLKASRDVFVYRAGPLRVETDLAGIRFKGSMLYAIHVSGDQAVALKQVMLEAYTEKSCSVAMQLGPLRVSAGFRCTFDLAVNALAAGIVHRDLGPLLYGKAHIMVAFSIAAWVELNFHLRIRFWRIRVTISWSKRFQSELLLGAEINLELAISKQPALYGHVQLEIHLFGYTFKPVVQIGDTNAPHLKAARAISRDIISPKSLLVTN